MQLITLAIPLMFLASAFSADWSFTEVHFKYGKLDIPEFAGGGSVNTDILNFQQASGWKYDYNYFFRLSDR